LSGPKTRPNISTKRGICAEPPVRATASIGKAASPAVSPERSSVSARQLSMRRVSAAMMASNWVRAMPHVYAIVAIAVLAAELDGGKVYRRQRDLGALDLVVEPNGVIVDQYQQLFCAMRHLSP
jgi:hypothetical protein